MSVETELTEAIELKIPTASPTMQSDLSMDGDTSATQNASVSSNKFSPSSQEAVNCEPKVKKRRKQSNPLKIQNPSSPKFDLPAYDIEQPEHENDQAVSYSVSEEFQNEEMMEKNRPSDYASQKSSLSRVTNALYNTKLREIAKSSTNSSKSKESSLQSLTDVSSPESSEEVLNNEYKNSVQNAFSQMPALLPINPVDVARDAMKLSNALYPFSEFSSPMQQGNMNLTISQRSFVTSNGVRVFNPEAYCELCEKEFCNKYFLKTHKANKHGICNVDNNTGGYSYKTSYKNMQMNNQTPQQAYNQMCETGANFGTSDSYCNICQKYFCNKYFLKKHRQNIHGIHEDSINPSSIHVPVISSPLPLVRPLILDSKTSENATGQMTKDEELKANVSIENIKNSSNSSVPLLNGSSPQVPQSKPLTQSINQKEKKGEKFLCELCNIEFCDKCYLDAHKINKHGQAKITGSEFPDFSEVGKTEHNEKSNQQDDVSDSKDSFKGQMCAPCMKNFTSAESFQCHMLEVHGASLKEEDETSLTSDAMNKKNGMIGLYDNENAGDKSPSSHEMENSNGSSDSSYNCSICYMKLRDKKSFLSHLETDHSIVGSAALEMCLLQEGTTCEVCQEQFLDRLALFSHKYKVHGMVPSGFEAYFDSIENGDYSFFSSGRQKSGGSSFCQICNKELCNKYFMKTHMMKMHGIDVDKGQPDRWPVAPGGGVYCDICQKYLCSKYFLKVHKQNVHGIMDDSTKLSVVGSPSYNTILSSNEKKIDWHSNNFSQGVKLNSNILNDSGLNSEDSKKRNAGNLFSCEICGQEFLDKISLQVHLVNKHVKSCENKMYPNNAASPFSISVEDSKDVLKNGVLPCSCCSFVNLDDSSKLSQLNSSDVKMISCIVCNVTYRQLDYHTHHLSHGVTLPAGKKLPSSENGIHELSVGFNHSGNHMVDPDNSEKLQPRKFKRFRCSKCDKTFRTKIRCLHHIQVMHKSKKGLSSQFDQQNPSKKISPSNLTFRKNLEQKINAHSPENGTGLIGGKEAEDKLNFMATAYPNAMHLPVPYKLPENSKVIMQPFHLTEPKPDGVSQQNLFVPSLVYLPVSQEVSETVTVAFTLTPA
ncbi:unnamed protein product [Larinioides sclopetarius]|uniref:C2H2-type domain-containing protein n=1 Tax=Larinioides sclopetarius TaxID=280406 RepID=A0AAV1Z1M2_9ARAC